MPLFLLLLAACLPDPDPKETGRPGEGEGEGDPRSGAASASTGECKGSPYRTSEPDTAYPADPHVEASATGSAVTVTLVDGTVNCCPSPEASWSVSGSTYEVVVDSETLETACACMCIMDISVEITDVSSGTWTFHAVMDGVDFGSAEVVVGG